MDTATAKQTVNQLLEDGNSQIMRVIDTLHTFEDEVNTALRGMSDRPKGPEKQSVPDFPGGGDIHQKIIHLKEGIAYMEDRVNTIRHLFNDYF